MSWQTLELRIEQSLATITLNHPQALNAIAEGYPRRVALGITIAANMIEETVISRGEMSR